MKRIPIPAIAVFILASWHKIVRRWNSAWNLQLWLVKCGRWVLSRRWIIHSTPDGAGRPRGKNLLEAETKLLQDWRRTSRWGCFASRRGNSGRNRKMCCAKIAVSGWSLEPLRFAWKRLSFSIRLNVNLFFYRDLMLNVRVVTGGNIKRWAILRERERDLFARADAQRLDFLASSELLLFFYPSLKRNKLRRCGPPEPISKTVSHPYFLHFSLFRRPFPFSLLKSLFMFCRLSGANEYCYETKCCSFWFCEQLTSGNPVA